MIPNLMASSFYLTAGLRKTEICNLRVRDLKTYRNQAVIDVIGKGRKFRRIPLKT
jgi:site-specific recombinase XerC